jgi:adenylate cyclase
MRRLFVIALSVALLHAPTVFAHVKASNQSPPPFQLVMIDNATEAKLGAFPINRAHVATAIDKLTAAGAKAIVLKFFYDQPSNLASDAVLAKSIASSKVLLQARIDDSEPKPNPLPAQFLLNAPTGRASISGVAGWIPLPAFANAAHAIGFIDATDANKVPAYVRYLDRSVKSLTVATLQAALDDAPIVIRAENDISFQSRRLPLDKTNQIVLTANALDESLAVNKIDALSFIDIVDGKFKPELIRGKVIVIGYDGAKMHSLKTPFGQLKAHRIFWLGLIDCWRQMHN